MVRKPQSVIRQPVYIRGTRFTGTVYPKAVIMLLVSPLNPSAEFQYTSPREYP
jgi:hypothetical protein